MPQGYFQFPFDKQNLIPHHSSIRQAKTKIKPTKKGYKKLREGTDCGVFILFSIAETTDDWFHFHFNYFIKKLNIRIFLVTPRGEDTISGTVSEGANQQDIESKQRN